jgi:serine/threonine protein kinase
MPGVPGLNPPPGSTPPPDPLIGKLLDRYQVVRKIGEGGMGSVYSVEHVMLRKRMAMKLLRAELSRNQELVTRFQNEAIAASRIGQENIVQVTDFGRTPEGLVYFVMEELQGLSLAEAIRRDSGLSPARTLTIALQVCRALHAAHAVGIIHRDLKPENIVLTEKEGFGEFAKVLDFGISKVSEGVNSDSGGTQRLTQLGMIVGTPEYMSPEQAAGKVVDHRSDIYSLGVVLFEMLTGKLPFEGDNPLQVLMKHQTEPAPSFEDVRPDRPVPAMLEVVIQRALAKKPQDRQQSMSDLLVDLQRAGEGAPAKTPPKAIPAPGMARHVSPQPLPLAGGHTPLSRPLTDRLPASDSAILRAVRPSRVGLWIGLALLLVGAGLLALNQTGRLDPVKRRLLSLTSSADKPEPSPEALAAPVPAPTTPPAQAKAEPPAQPVAASPEAAVEKTPKGPGNAVKATGGSSRPHKATPPAKSTPRAAAPAPAATAPPPVPPVDPYQKVDDLKQPY